jgi:hypothetical protein
VQAGEASLDAVPVVLDMLGGVLAQGLASLDDRAVRPRATVEKLVCAPAPFQSPGIGLASIVTATSKSSATRYRR